MRVRKIGENEKDVSKERKERENIQTREKDMLYAI